MSLVERGFYFLMLCFGIAIALACGVFWWAAQYYEWEWVFYESVRVVKPLHYDEEVVRSVVPYFGAVVCQIVIGVISGFLMWNGFFGFTEARSANHG